MYTRRYQFWLLVSLLMVNVFNQMDRSLFGILGQSIKSDLKLSDTQLGIAGGAAFIIVYNLLSFPLANIADHGMRKRVIVWSIFVWCSITSLVGYCGNFWQLVLARMGVGLGEAGVLPATQALVAIQVSAHRRGLAFGVLLFGGALGAAAAPLLGGWVNDRLGWRSAFMVIGLLGLLLIPLVMLSVREHVLAVPGARAAETVAEGPSLGRAIRHLAGIPAYRMLWISSSLMFFAPSAYLTYSAPFFIRDFGISAAEAGRYLGVAFGIGSVGGVMVGGYLYDRFGRTSLRTGLKVPTLGALLGAMVAIPGWLSGSVPVAVICFLLSQFLASWVNAPVPAAALALAPVGTRSMSSAVFHLSSVFGGVLGPLTVGLISDLVQPSLGTHSLAPALAVAAAVQLLGALVLCRVGQTVNPELFRDR